MNQRRRTPAWRAGLIITAAGLLVLSASTTTAERHRHGDAAAESGWRLGAEAGRRDGDRLGRSEGRRRILVGAFQDGFRDAACRPVDRHDLRDARAEGRAAGEQRGAFAGRELGLEDGWDSAAEGFLALRGVPREGVVSAPRVEPSTPPEVACCRQPGPISIDVPGCAAVSVPIRRLERSGRCLDEVKPCPPGGKRRRKLAREAGFVTDEDQHHFADAYERGYLRAWHRSFERGCDVSSGELRRYERRGFRAGRDEAVRRASCEAHRREYHLSYEQAFADGYAEGHHESFGAAVQHHRKNPVVYLTDAALVDADEDGILEPGETVRLVGRLVNAGLARLRDGLDWSASGVSVTHPRGPIAQGLRGQTAREIDARLLVVDETAPVGRTLVVTFDTDEATELRHRVRRPLGLDAVSVELGSHRGELALMTTVRCHNRSTRRLDRDLVIAADGVERRLPVLAAGETTLLELPVVIDARQLADKQLPLTVELSEGPLPWERQRVRHDVDVRRLLAVMGRLDDPLALFPVVQERLHDEFSWALSEPRRFAKLKERSQLAVVATGIGLLPDRLRVRFMDEVIAPLYETSQAKRVPRKVRRAWRKTWG
ncbi:MAG: hypothetical protein AAF533_13040 [Acidobacteriota bacterium]